MKYSLPTETEGGTHTGLNTERSHADTIQDQKHRCQWHVAVELRMAHTSHILYMIGLVWISYKIFLIGVMLKSMLKKKPHNQTNNQTKNPNRCIFINFFVCLFAVSCSIGFGKVGGRCKSSQCQGVCKHTLFFVMCFFFFVFLLRFRFVICSNKISLRRSHWPPP